MKLFTDSTNTDYSTTSDFGFFIVAPHGYIFQMFAVLPCSSLNGLASYTLKWNKVLEIERYLQKRNNTQSYILQIVRCEISFAYFSIKTMRCNRMIFSNKIMYHKNVDVHIIKSTTICTCCAFYQTCEL